MPVHLYFFLQVYDVDLTTRVDDRPLIRNHVYQEEKEGFSLNLIRTDINLFVIQSSVERDLTVNEITSVF